MKLTTEAQRHKEKLLMTPICLYLNLRNLRTKANFAHKLCDSGYPFFFSAPLGLCGASSPRAIRLRADG